MKMLKIQNSSHKMLAYKIKNKEWVLLIAHYYITFNKQPQKNQI